MPEKQLRISLVCNSAGSRHEPTLHGEDPKMRARKRQHEGAVDVHEGDTWKIRLLFPFHRPRRLLVAKIIRRATDAGPRVAIGACPPLDRLAFDGPQA